MAFKLGLEKEGHDFNRWEAKDQKWVGVGEQVLPYLGREWDAWRVRVRGPEGHGVEAPRSRAATGSLGVSTGSLAT